jgi:N-acyl-D-aspartate/D-glutamate deacylase
VALARQVASYDGVWAAHLRYQELGRRGAWTEAIEVAQESGAAVHVSHERLDDEVLPEIERAVSEDVDITFDSYLYSAGMTHLAMLLPIDVQAGGNAAMLERMADPTVRERSLSHLRERIGPRGNHLVAYTRSGRYIGMTLAEAATEAGKTWEEFAYQLIVEEDGVETFSSPWQVTPDEAERIISRTAVHPRMMIASDGIYNIPWPHPRAYGCFARVLRRFVRELKMLSLEQAVYKMSGFPAQRFGLGDRGRIAGGMAADVVVFDAAEVGERSTWQEPIRSPSGIGWVFVNGQPVIAEGRPTGTLPGRVLRRSH